VILNASDKSFLGVLVLEVGGVSETVTVSADPGVMQVKTASGEMAMWSPAVKSAKSA